VYHDSPTALYQVQIAAQRASQSVLVAAVNNVHVVVVVY
jgi:hypothetical protein